MKPPMEDMILKLLSQLTKNEGGGFLDARGYSSELIYWLFHPVGRRAGDLVKGVDGG